MSSALDILHQFGIRPSHQRLTVLTYLMEHRDHSSAEEIFENLHKEMPMISRTTVYNTLRLFSDAGVVQTLSRGASAGFRDQSHAPRTLLLPLLQKHHRYTSAGGRLAADEGLRWPVAG